MKEFLRAFNSGVFEKDLSGEQKELARNLLNIGAISAHKGRLYLNDGYVFGRLDIARDGTGYLQSFDDRFKADLIIENRYLSGVHLGDLILAKILSSRKSRLHAKVLMCVKPAFLTLRARNFRRERQNRPRKSAQSHAKIAKAAARKHPFKD